MADKIKWVELKSIQVKFNEKFSNYFDFIENSAISNRLGDRWFTDLDKPMLWPRPGTKRVGNALIVAYTNRTYSQWNYVKYSNKIFKALRDTSSTPPSWDWQEVTPFMQSVQFFYTDRTRKRRHYRVFDKNLYYLSDANQWEKIRDVGTNDVWFQVVKIPVNLNNSNPDERTTAKEASTTEAVARDTNDGAGDGNQWYVGKTLLVTSGIYKWCYAPIISYDKDKAEYILAGAGIITKLPTGIKYKIFDTTSDCLQICRPDINGRELYFNGITECSYVEWFATDSLRQINALLPTQSLPKMEIFNNKCWTFAEGTLYSTGWFPGNPLFFNFTGALTIGGNGSISDIFPYKNRMVILWENYIYSLRWELVIDRHITAYGGMNRGQVSTGDDIYIMTTQKTIISLSETINGVVLLKNVWEQVDNFIRDFSTGVAFWFDSKHIYLYWQKDMNTVWKMVVYDIKRKMWFLYTGFPPMSIISDGSHVYINDNNSDIVREFDAWLKTDVTIEWDSNATLNANVKMSFALREIDNWDIFTKKVLKRLWFAFENVSQNVIVNTYMASEKWVWRKTTKTITVLWQKSTNSSLGSENIGTNTFWKSTISDIIYPANIWTIDYGSDEANVYKITLEWENGSPFYISQMDIEIWFATSLKQYRNPSNTI